MWETDRDRELSDGPACGSTRPGHTIVVVSYRANTFLLPSMVEFLSEPNATQRA